MAGGTAEGKQAAIDDPGPLYMAMRQVVKRPTSP